MNSNIVFGQYYNTNSWIHKLDPRTKIVGILGLLISLFLLNDITSLLIAFGITILLILSTKIPIMKFLRSLKMVTVLLFVTIIFQVLLNQGNDYTPIEFHLNILNLCLIILLFISFFLSKKVITKFRFLLFLIIFIFSFYLQTITLPTQVLFTYTLKFYKRGIETSVIVILRIVSLIFLSQILSLTTKPTDLNNGLEKLLKPLKIFKINVNILTMMISIAIRFIPTLINEANKILKAQASRGVDFKEASFKDKINQIISLLVPMFVISYKRAYDLADAMEARGYIPEAERTSINLLKFKGLDYLFFFFVAIMLSLSIVYKVVIL